MINRINSEPTDLESTCRIFLELAARDLADAKRTRAYYASLARKHGCSNAFIGEALGISEARVRQIVAGGDAE